MLPGVTTPLEFGGVAANFGNGFMRTTSFGPAGGAVGIVGMLN